MGLGCEKNAKLAAFFLSNQTEIAFKFGEISTIIPRWRAAYQNAKTNGDLDVFIAEEFQACPQYLEKAFSSGDSLWLDLYVGEKVKQGYAVDGKFSEANSQIRTVIDEEIAYLTNAAKIEGLNADLSDLQNALNSVRSVIRADTSRTLRILWIADCLYLDIQSFISAPLAFSSLALQPDIVTSKNPVECREQIIAYLESKSYDAIFYSPFSYGNSIAYANLFRGTRAVSNFVRAKRLAYDELSSVEAVVRLLCEIAECPVFVHNVSGVMQNNGGWRDAVRDVVTLPARILFRRTANYRLERLSRRLNAEQAGSQMIVIDECAVARSKGLRSCGSFLHLFGTQHPARLGRYLASTYVDSLITIHTLLRKKVVICDLDNTLWKGLIGEGAIDHHLDRQSILKALKSKGVLLAVNSKNDADNVTWDGAVLGGDDFAAMRINWNTKVQNIGELAEEMNLNSNSFVFIDDRADERAMVSSVYPETVTLDSEDPATWRRLSLWAQMLSGVGVIDRTQIYKKRLEREKFVSANHSLPEAKLFEQLDLRCGVALSDTKSLPRISELLNRTNQFNTTGRRPSLKQVQSWHDDPAWSIYVAKATDRYGDMGLVSVLVAQENENYVEIEAFVLSCRVFGYGIETALLKALADASNGKTIGGFIVPTSVNQPCQNVYAAHNFRCEGGHWIFDRGCKPIDNKSWLKVENNLEIMVAV
jgi:FkbH-like protein